MSNSTQPPQAALDQIIGLYNQGQLEETVSLAESLAEQYPNSLILYEILGATFVLTHSTKYRFRIFIVVVSFMTSNSLNRV